MMYLLIMIHWHYYMMIVTSHISNAIRPIRYLQDEDDSSHSAHLYSTFVPVKMITPIEQQRIHEVHNILVGSQQQCT